MYYLIQRLSHYLRSELILHDFNDNFFNQINYTLSNESTDLCVIVNNDLRYYAVYYSKYPKSRLTWHLDCKKVIVTIFCLYIDLETKYGQNRYFKNYID